MMFVIENDDIQAGMILSVRLCPYLLPDNVFFNETIDYFPRFTPAYSATFRYVLVAGECNLLNVLKM